MRHVWQLQVQRRRNGGKKHAARTLNIRPSFSFLKDPPSLTHFRSSLGLKAFPVWLSQCEAFHTTLSKTPLASEATLLKSKAFGLVLNTCCDNRESIIISTNELLGNSNNINDLDKINSSYLLIYTMLQALCYVRWILGSLNSHYCALT